MKKLVLAAVAAVVGVFAGRADVIYVTPEGGGDGTSWSSPKTITEAISAAAATDEIRLKAGTYPVAASISITKATTIKGGYAGDDGDPEALAAEPISVFDSNEATGVTKIFNVTTGGNASTTNYFERIEVTRGYQYGLYKSGNASLVLKSCRITRNGRWNSSNYYGRGLYCVGTTSYSLATITDCVFSENQMTNTANIKNMDYGYGGWAGYFQNMKRVTIDNALVVSNGLSRTRANGLTTAQDNSYASGFSLRNAPLTLRNSEFRANIIGVNSAMGGVVRFSENCNGSVISNCLFAGNLMQKVHEAGNTTTTGAAITFNMNSFAHKAEIVNCTFAYNLTDGHWTPADISITKADVKVRNSIFHGAFFGKYLKCGRNIHVSDGAKGDIDYCLFDGEGAGYVSAITSTDLSWGDHNVVGDPQLVTAGAALSPYTFTNGNYFGFDVAHMNELVAIDAHVGNAPAAYSAAIDAGDPSGDYSNEPSPNGGRINLGYYGNTAGAATSAGGVPAIADGFPTVTFADDTKAIVTVKLAEGTACNAVVTIDVGPEHYSVGGVQPGGTVVFETKSLNAVGSTVTAAVTVSAAGLSPDIQASPSGTATGTLPPWYGHGGGANVIHVRAGADGLGDGSDWANAFDSMFDAMLYLSTHSEKTEMWIAGTVVPTAASVARAIPSATFVFRGGFTGVEDSEVARAPGAISTLDGNGSYASLEFSNAHPVLIERLKFTRSSASGVKKTGGAGDVTISDCIFQDNINDNDGEGCYFAGTSAATVSITNCLFANNRANGNQTSPAGRAIYASTLRRVFIDDTLFTTNGSRISQGPHTSQDGKNNCDGGVIYATGAPLTVRNCEFRANRSPIRGTTGGLIRLNGASAPTAFTNCVFTGGQNTFGESNIYNPDQNKSPNAGVIAMTMANAADVCELYQCTMAYNLTDAYKVPGAIAVVKGTLRARNTIFYKNVWGPMSEFPHEIYLHADGYAELDYVWLTDAGSSLGAADMSHYTTSNLNYGDPHFVTPTATFESLIASATTSGYTYHYLNNNAAGQQGQLALDVHLLSPKGYWKNDGSYSEDADTVSEAIDKGDPLADCSLEPAPNGGRVNLGYCGGTAKASKTSAVTPVVENATLDFPNGFSQPRIVVDMGANDPADIYSATVTLVCYTGAVANVGTAFTNVYNNVGNGDSVTNWVPWCYQAGVPVHVRVMVQAAGVSDIDVPIDGTVTGTAAPGFGHGGGAEVVHVNPSATGLGDGSDWFNAYTDFASAVANLNGRREIWVARGTVVNSSVSTTINASSFEAIRGGFEGSEDSPAARTDGARSVFDAERTRVNAFQLTTGYAVEIDGCEFVNATEHGFSKLGDGGITLVNCRFANNRSGTWNVNGRGASLSGAGTSTAVITNCLFEGNVFTAEGGTQFGNGGGLYVTGFRSMELVDSLFLTNGVAPSANYGGLSPGRDGFRASALFINAVSSTVTRCEFRANRGTTRENGRGGCAWIEGAANGTLFENCLFLGNYENVGWGSVQDGTGGGAIVVNLSTAAGTITVKRTTVAYNISGQRCAAAGISVMKGTLNLVDSIVYGNTTPDSRLVGRDFALTTGDGYANISYSMLTSNDVAYVSGTGLSFGEGVQYGDPLLATSFAAADALVVDRTYNSMHYTNDLDQVIALDAHLRSKAGYWLNDGTYVTTDDATSKAIDVGHPDSPYANETSPNGGRVNLGRYGNTAEASHSNVGQPEIESIVTECVGDFTRPRVTVTLGAATEDVDYNAEVTIIISVGGVEVGRHTETGVGNGGTAVCYPPVYLAEDSVFDVSIAVTAPGAVSRFDARENVAVTGKLPPWYGHGGPSNVIHVREGADGQNTGLDWTDAYSDIGKAIDDLSAEKNEIWVSGRIELRNILSAISPAAAFTMRGGFTGAEDAAADRAEGTVAVIDYCKTVNGLDFNTAQAVEIDRVVFRNSKDSSGFIKRGSGNLVLRDCRFETNVRDVSANVDGRGLRVSGTAGVTEVLITNCVFAGNAMHASGERYCGRGAGAFFSSLRSVTLVDSLFVTNGVNITMSPNSIGGDITLGSAIYASSAPILARRCRFLGNLGITRDNSNHSGGAIRLQGSCGGSRFENCVFSGNYDRCGWTGQPGDHGGTLVVELSDSAGTVTLESCTMAYNMADGRNCPAGVFVISGDVTAHNSIFYGNLRNKTMVANGYAADVHVAADSKFSARYCLFTDSTSNSVWRAEGGTLDIAWATCVTGDPKFVTTLAEYEALTSYNGNYRYYNGTYTDYATFDCRLKSRANGFRGTMSPAIDAGDPASDYSLEPDVDGVGSNGRRINLGAYGNTPWATMTPLRGNVLRLR